MDDLQILTQSIGEYAVDTVGRENIRGLQVVMNPVDQTAQIAVVLADDSDESQKAALRALFDVEAVYLDEAVLSFAFVDDLEQADAAFAARQVYSYA